MKHITPSKPTILVTGGHITPAVATIESIGQLHPDWRILFVGRKTSLEGARVLSEEYSTIHAKGIPFIPITAGRIKRDGSIWTLWAFLKIPVGIIQAFYILARMRPTAVLSFGGYVAVPVVLAAWCMRIPVVTHEQTTYAGLANRIIARLATRTCVSFPDVQNKLGKNVTLTGLPMRRNVFVKSEKAPFIVDAKLPMIFVTGGSTGSVSINETMFKSLESLLTQNQIVHQVGRLSIDAAQKVRDALPKNVQDRYIPVPYLDEQAYAWILDHAVIIVGRSGANTVMELAAKGSIALFIPLPWASGNEQYTNAEFMQRAGSAVILRQRDLTPEKLIQMIEKIKKNEADMKSAAQKLRVTISHDGAVNLTQVLADVIRTNT